MTGTERTYDLVTVAGRKAIRCRLCGRISEAAREVAARVCDRCRMSHDVVAEARAAVADGAGHECDEWQTARGLCAVCGPLAWSPCRHQWEVIAQVFRGEIDAADPVAHTVFMLFGCMRCRTVDAFPPMNAALMTPGYRTTLRQQLAAGGWTLPEGISWGGGWRG